MMYAGSLDMSTQARHADGDPSSRPAASAIAVSVVRGAGDLAQLEFLDEMRIRTVAR